MQDGINLRELLIIFAKRWRMIILFALIFGILLGGYKCYSLLSNFEDSTIKNKQMQYESALDAYSLQKSVLESQISSLEQSIDQGTVYLQNSILMNINPFEKCIASLTFLIDTGYEIDPELSIQTPDKLNTLLTAYLVDAKSEEVYKAIRQQIGLDINTIYLQELITVSNMNNGIVTIECVGEDIQLAETMTQIVFENLKSKSQKYQNQIGTHIITITDQASYKITDLQLIQTRQVKINELSTNINSLIKSKQSLDNLSQPVLTLLSMVDLIKSGMKYGIVGIIGGVVFAMLAAILLYTMKNTITGEMDLSKYFGLSLLGTISYNSKRKHNFIDQWIINLESGRTPILNDTEHLRVIGASIIQQVPEGQVILCAGSIDSTVIAEFCEKLTETFSSLGASGRYVLVSGNILYSADTIVHINKQSHAILVESKGSSMTIIARELKAFDMYGLKVIGAVMI